jgi:hypothetical protein
MQKKIPIQRGEISEKQKNATRSSEALKERVRAKSAEFEDFGMPVDYRIADINAGLSQICPMVGKLVPGNEAVGNDYDSLLKVVSENEKLITELEKIDAQIFAHKQSMDCVDACHRRELADKRAEAAAAKKSAEKNYEEARSLVESLKQSGDCGGGVKSRWFIELDKLVGAGLQTLLKDNSTLNLIQCLLKNVWYISLHAKTPITSDAADELIAAKERAEERAEKRYQELHDENKRLIQNRTQSCD